MLNTEFLDNSSQLFLRFKAISRIEYARIAQDFCSFSRRKNRRVANSVTIFTTQKMGKKAGTLGIVFAGNRLLEMASHEQA
jgi:hypothetical protein